MLLQQKAFPHKAYFQYMSTTTMYCPPSKSKRSYTTICQLLIIHSMSLVIPSQQTTFFAQRFVLVMPWCPLCSCFRTCAHYDSGISSASPHRISPSFTVSVETCDKYILKFFSTSEASCGYPLIIICDCTHSSGSEAITSWNAVFCWVVKSVW